MLESPVKFFKNLPKKRCYSCKKPMVEQADCYTNKCEKCTPVI
ncbi:MULTISPECIES: protein YhfH [Allobacillus]|uniref:YhfH family protein n=1 Tax=Allobacillus halotolerans TaxID=570278 RepID=A0ABS6GRY9_9BACI|nr:MULTISPECIES: protein YhfH [Allobacillus]MBU6081656.1 YhfH family protein [Allobacillus halotolerans]TSJ66361.1 YhfH family protein [Allobacillus sp. SKP2-8]